jgi:hypothetical protein
MLATMHVQFQTTHGLHRQFDGSIGRFGAEKMRLASYGIQRGSGNRFSLSLRAYQSG